jgi:hypothetical protein
MTAAAVCVERRHTAKETKGLKGHVGAHSDSVTLWCSVRLRLRPEPARYGLQRSEKTRIRPSVAWRKEVAKIMGYMQYVCLSCAPGVSYSAIEVVAHSSTWSGKAGSSFGCLRIDFDFCIFLFTHSIARCGTIFLFSLFGS